MKLADRLLDTALDLTVVPGYSKIGYGVRRRMAIWPADGARMDGRTVLVTGATGGLGLAAAQGFAALGADVVLLGRNPEKLAAAHHQVTGSTTVQVDLADLAAVRAFASGWDRPLAVLVNNAGVLPPERTENPQGVELTLATNVLAGFLLTDVLSPYLEGGRVVNVSSGGMYGQKLDVEKLEREQPWSGVAAYARTKRAQVVLTDLWAQRLRGRVGVHAMHPGWADTPGVTTSLATFGKVMGPVLRTAEQGADTVVWLGSTTQALGEGGFWQDRRRRPEHLLPWTRETETERQALWDLCVRLTE